MAIAGQSILMNANAPNFGAMYVMLDEFHHRAQHGLSGPAIAAELQSKLQEEIRDGLVNVFDAPPVDGLGTAGGFKIVVQDRGDLGSNEIEAVADRIVEESRSPDNSRLLAGAIHELSRQYTVALPRHRPRQGQAGGCFDLRAVQHPSGLPGLALRQRLQPVRPHLAGQRAGRGQFPQADRTI